VDCNIGNQLSPQFFSYPELAKKPQLSFFEASQKNKNKNKNKTPNTSTLYIASQATLQCLDSWSTRIT
jgi:hypothetical protein